MKRIIDSEAYELQQKFAERLTEIMEERGLDAVYIAGEIGIGSVQLTQYCEGLRMPRAIGIVRLARALDVTTDYLLGN